MKAQDKRHFMESQKPSTPFRQLSITHHKSNQRTWFLNLPLDECIDNTKGTKKWFESKARLKSKSVLTTSKVATTPKSFPSCKTIFVPKLSPPC
jgi:hypothetical protein